MGTQISETLLEFAFRLVQADLTRDREGDRLNWVAEFESFFGVAQDATLSRSQVVVFPKARESVATMTLEELRDLQREARELLRAAAVSRLSRDDSARFLHPLSKAAATHWFRAEVEVRVLPTQRRKYFFDDNPKDAFEIQIFGDPKAAFLMALVMVLAQTEKLPLGICPEDQRLFFRVRRQLYCSRQCVLRANKRAYLKRKDESKRARKRGRKK